MLSNLAILGLALVLIDAAAGEEAWPSLRVKWGVNLFNSFVATPRTEAAAIREGWARIRGGCSEGKFLGVRYIKPNDSAVIVLYDRNGFVAGMQQGFPRRDVERVASSYNYRQSTTYQLGALRGVATYFLTAYFVEPSIICSKGRTERQYQTQGSGYGLFLQNGTNPLRDSVRIPMRQEGMQNTMWVRGGCMPTMGRHYWYNISNNMSCGNFFPFGVIYNRGKLNSFFFATLGLFKFSNRFEHPPKISLRLFFDGPTPQCLTDEYEISGGVSTMHVFFDVRPQNLLC